MKCTLTGTYDLFQNKILLISTEGLHVWFGMDFGLWRNTNYHLRFFPEKKMHLKRHEVTPGEWDHPRGHLCNSIGDISWGYNGQMLGDRGRIGFRIGILLIHLCLWHILWLEVSSWTDVIIPWKVDDSFAWVTLRGKQLSQLLHLLEL